jgi:hypothetical protein
MSLDDVPGTGRDEPPAIRAGRPWAGGCATAVVAALAVLVGVYITRDVLGIPVLAPAHAGSPIAVYAAVADGCALLATALLHMPLLGMPRPLSFSAGSRRLPSSWRWRRPSRSPAGFLARCSRRSSTS